MISIKKPSQDTYSQDTYSKEKFMTLERLRWITVTTLMVWMVSNPALAQSLDPIGILEKIINIINTGLARALAIIALAIMGIGCWYGFFDFRKIGFFFIGIIFVFGGSWIMDQFTSTGGTGGNTP